MTVPGNIYWIASYPKSGNTWMRAFISQFIQDEPASFDINSINSGAIASSREWVQSALDFDIHELNCDEVDFLRPEAYTWLSQQLQNPGYHKVHDAYDILPDGRPLFPAEATRGVLYIVRNPLDVAVSFANHSQKPLDSIINAMANNDFAFAGNSQGLPAQLRQRLGSWSFHVLSWRDKHRLPVKLVRYEDMLADPLATFSSVASFLQLTEDEYAVRVAVNACSFENLQTQEKQTVFREKPQVAPAFFRKGQAGDWKNALNPEQAARIIQDHGVVMRSLGYCPENESRLDAIVDRSLTALDCNMP